jgi:FAD/FMN-containing dehydrogenase
MAELRPAALDAFRDAFAGEVILPRDPGYDAARVVWNGMVDRRPALVVRPTSTADVVSAVRFARGQDLLVAVRGGGHSISGLSTCDGGIVIDLSRLRGAEVDPATRIARVNGGALLGELDDAAQAFDLVCPVGVVSHTGVGGLTLGGGMGRLHRKLGLTIDNLLAIELVTADGRVVRASDEENADLFWGLRGAGPNFGIATSFEFRLHPLAQAVTFGIVLHPLERASELAALFRTFVESAPDEVMATFGLGHDAGRPVAWINACHCGPLDQADRDLAPIRAYGPPLVDTFRPIPYLDVQHANDDAMEWGHRFYMKSGFTPSLPDELVARCVERVSQAHNGAEVSIWSWGRAIGRVAEDAMAFTGREAEYWVSAETLWDDPEADEANTAWGRGTMAALEPFTMAGRYVNDVAEAGDDVVRSIYGDAKYKRLVALKRAWDPDNVFRLNQNVRP